MGIGSTGKGPRTVLSEINVTPLVDVMLVLLIIFMVTAGAESVEMEMQRQRTLEMAEEMLEEARAEKKKQQPEKKKEHSQVPIDLPPVDSERVVLSEVRKLKLVMDDQLVFSIDGTIVVRCLEVAPGVKKWLRRAARGEIEARQEQKDLEPCLEALGEKLVDNEKLKKDKELYLLADRKIDYGKVLRVMAAIRQAGVTKFGLVADPGILGDATVEPTPEPVK